MPPERDKNESIREEILSQCPFTRLYLNSSARENNSRQWNQDFEKQGKLIDNHVERRFGKSWEQELLFPQYIWARNLNLLLPALGTSEKLVVVKRIFRFGYEMGATVDPILLQDNIMIKLAKDGFLNPTLQKSKIHLGKAVLKEGLGSIMDAGTFFRRNPRFNVTELPPGIQKSLGEIDFSGLDK